MIKNIILVGICLICINTLKAQHEISLGAYRPDYHLSDLESFGDQFLREIISELNIPAQITDNYPAKNGLEITYRYLLNNLSTGIRLSSHGSGHRIAYSDYSGVLNIDQKISTIDLAITIYNEVGVGSKAKLLMGINTGISRTKYSFKNSLSIAEQSTSETIDFHSNPFFVEPEFELRIIPFNSPVFCGLNVRHAFHFKDKIYLSESPDNYLLNNNNDPVYINWSGIRVGIRCGINF